jgi:hypothetical protein
LRPRMTHSDSKNSRSRWDSLGWRSLARVLASI